MASRTAKKVSAKKATAKRTAKKATKKVTKVAKANTIDLTDSIKKIRTTASKVNAQVMDTASDVAVDLRKNGEQLREVAVERVKEAIENLTDRVSEVTETVTETVTVENMVDTAKSINEYTLKTAEEVVDGAIANGEKWQGIGHKAVKGGLKLAAKQQDIMFDTLEVVKGQLTGSAKRFKKLFQNK